MRNHPLDLTLNETLVGSNICGLLGFPVAEHSQCLNATR